MYIAVHQTIFTLLIIRLPTSWGKLLAELKITLVYGAGKTGLMGVLADSVLNNGETVTGVVSENLNQPQLIHAKLTSLEVTADIQSRQRRMLDIADAMIALPGGFGSFYELLEALTWAQIGIHQKPIGILILMGFRSFFRDDRACHAGGFSLP